jgi:hypothetical protein
MFQLWHDYRRVAGDATKKSRFVPCKVIGACVAGAGMLSCANAAELGLNWCRIGAGH